jgi:tRNA threonylcarbamoyladenosine biosynthesis protein TsaB
MRDNVLLAVVHGDATRTHGERLPRELDVALQQAGVSASELELLAVASGPGAFTGLRIGLAAIQGLAMVWQTPTIGVSALDALAEAALDMVPRTNAAVSAWMDAQRRAIFAAWYRRSGATPLQWDAHSVPFVGEVAEVMSALPEQVVDGGLFIGDGAVRYRAEITRLTKDTALVIDPPPALAPMIGRLALARAARGDAGPPHALQPLYVRRSDAELAKAARLSTT